MARTPKGGVGISSHRGRLRLRLPRSLFGGTTQYLYTGLPDTPLNRQAVEARAKEIEADIAFNRFDTTLERYRWQANPGREDGPELKELWAKFTEFKRRTLAQTTIDRDFKRVANWLNQCPYSQAREARKIRAWLRDKTTPQAAKKILMWLSACCDWAVEQGTIGGNPFSTLPRIRERAVKPQIQPFSREEMQVIITAFDEHPQWCHYGPFVRFLFYTGARTSEAIGLQWASVTSAHILFNSALVGKVRKGTKNGTVRRFPINEQLRQLLASIRPDNPTPDRLVFVAPGGTPIDAHNFTNRLWKTTLDSLGIAYRSQYHTRHTFISLCLQRGVDVVEIAQWVGNSPKTIWEHYAGLIQKSVPPEI